MRAISWFALLGLTGCLLANQGDVEKAAACIDADGDGVVAGYSSPFDRRNCTLVCDAEGGPSFTAPEGFCVDGDVVASAIDDQRPAIAALDCDDLNRDRFPGNAEIPYDLIDNDCDGIDRVDADGDGYAAIGRGDYEAAVLELYGNTIVAIDQWRSEDPTVMLIAGVDCDDSDATVNPGAGSDLYDGEDTDCRAANRNPDLGRYVWDYDRDGDCRFDERVISEADYLAYAEAADIPPELRLVKGDCNDTPGNTATYRRGEDLTGKICDGAPLTDTAAQADAALYPTTNFDCSTENPFDRDEDGYIAEDQWQSFVAYAAQYGEILPSAEQLADGDPNVFGRTSWERPALGWNAATPDCLDDFSLVSSSFYDIDLVTAALGSLTDADIHPGVVNTPNFIQEDCNATVRDVDLDADGFAPATLEDGTPIEPNLAAANEAYAAIFGVRDAIATGDCNDENAQQAPGLTERFEGAEDPLIDSDCVGGPRTARLNFNDRAYEGLVATEVVHLAGSPSERFDIVVGAEAIWEPSSTLQNFTFLTSGVGPLNQQPGVFVRGYSLNSPQDGEIAPFAYLHPGTPGMTNEGPHPIELEIYVPDGPNPEPELWAVEQSYGTLEDSSVVRFNNPQVSPLGFVATSLDVDGLGRAIFTGDGGTGTWDLAASDPSAIEPGVSGELVIAVDAPVGAYDVCSGGTCVAVGGVPQDAEEGSRRGEHVIRINGATASIDSELINVSGLPPFTEVVDATAIQEGGTWYIGVVIQTDTGNQAYITAGSAPGSNELDWSILDMSERDFHGLPSRALEPTTVSIALSSAHIAVAVTAVPENGFPSGAGPDLPQFLMNQYLVNNLRPDALGWFVMAR